MRLRTFHRAHAASRARKSLLPVVITIAVLAAGGVAAGTVGAMAAAPSAEQLSPRVAPTAERPIDQETAFQVTVAQAVQHGAAGKVDTAALADAIDDLGDSSSLPDRSVRVLTREMRVASAAVSTAMTAYNAQVAAAQAAADAAAQAAAAAEALAQANTPDGARATARSLAADQYGWGDDQFSCLDSLWQKESGWDYRAYNPSGATGIPQSLPGSKMASFGSDWETNATTQIAWGLDYISAVYGTPCSAWGHSQSVNWY